MSALARHVSRAVLFLTAAIGVPTFPASAAAPPGRLNVVFFLADDLGWADTGCYGGDLHETPNIDRLAREGVRFTDAYAASSVCSPTRASIMTGKSPARLHMTIWREDALVPPRDRKLLPPITVADLPHTEVSIARVLHEAGYLTALVGKWHLGDPAHYPETHGFDINIGGTIWGMPPTYFYPYRGREAWGEIRYVPHLEGGKTGEYLTDRLTDEALKIIDQAGDRPFFLYLAHHAVHIPMEAKRQMAEHYRKKLDPHLHHQNATYAAMTQSLDESVGRVLAKLKERGIADRTVFIFTSDNGGYIGKDSGTTVPDNGPLCFADNGGYIGNDCDKAVTDNYPLRSGKGSLYEGGVRVPLIVCWPGVTPASGVCREPVVSTDFYPTLLEILGLKGDAKHNKKLDGRSIAGLLKHPAATLGREALFFHYPHYYQTTTPVSSIREHDWKLLEYFEDNHLELYNLSDDPSETRNLAAQNPRQAERLRGLLHDWRESMHAQLPVANRSNQSSVRR